MYFSEKDNFRVKELADLLNKFIKEGKGDYFINIQDGTFSTIVVDEDFECLDFS